MKKNEFIKNEWLITIDLDGTTIGKKSSDNEEYEIPQINIDAIAELKKLGHHVAIVTGRPWRLTKEIYELLKIDTIVVNHNGAFIHKPKDKGFRNIETAMNRELVQKILKDPIVIKSSLNILLDFDSESKAIDIQDTSFLSQFHLIQDKKSDNLTSFKLGDEFETDPFNIAIRVNYKNVDPKELIINLRRKWGNGFAFRYWITEELNLMSLEINPIGANKGKALEIIAGYYNIPMSNTIAFGDGLNDIQMLQTANFGIAMKNGHPVVKEIAKDITDKTNEEGGVGYYLIDFFELDIK